MTKRILSVVGMILASAFVVTGLMMVAFALLATISIVLKPSSGGK